MGVLYMLNTKLVPHYFAALLRACVICVLCSAEGAWATSVLPPDFQQLIRESDFIVHGVVRNITPETRVTATGARTIVSKVEIQIKEIVAGKPPTPLILEVFGGEMGGRQISIAGAPRFRVGDESVIFVQGNGKQIYPLVRMMHGVYPIRKAISGGREYIARSNGEPLTEIEEVSLPSGRRTNLPQLLSQREARALSPSEFVQKIRAAAKESPLHEN
jgi:hypothetical protein